MGGIGVQRLAVAGLRLGGPPEHLQHQGAVGQRPGAGRSDGAVEHLTEERERPGRIAAHREGGGGGGADPGRDRGAARLQHPVEQAGRRGRVPGAQPGVRQPARGAQRGARQRLPGTGDERSEDAGGGGRIPGEQVDARPADVEGGVPRIANRGGLRGAARVFEFAAVEQQAHQLHPLVPAPFMDRREQEVTAAGAEPALLVSRQQAPPLGGPVRIRILGEQLPEPEARRGIRRGFGDGPPEPRNRFLAPSEKGETPPELIRGSRGRAGRPDDGLEERQGSVVVVFRDVQPRALQQRCC